jgi:hypothetical protein
MVRRNARCVGIVVAITDKKGEGLEEDQGFRINNGELLIAADCG